MISILLRDMRWRLLPLLGLFAALLWWEIEARRHGTLDPAEIGPVSAAAPMAYLASLTMIILLAGFISTDRREGYTRLFFSHPTSPLALYGVRWALAYLVALTLSFLFLLLLQVLTWGELRGGWSGLLLPVITALIFGGLIAFLSAALPRGDGWVAFVLFLPTLFPQIFSLVLDAVAAGLRNLVLFLLPPQTTALQVVYEGLLVGEVAWVPALFAAGYGLVWLVLGALLVKVREWP